MCTLIIYHSDLAERFVSGKRFGESVPGIHRLRRDDDRRGFP